MRRLSLVLSFVGTLSVVACFTPERPAQLTCSSEGACPDGLVCDSENKCAPLGDESVDANNLDEAVDATIVVPDAETIVDAAVVPPDARETLALAPCLVGGNTIYFDGEPKNFVHPGTSLITEATFFASGSMTSITMRATPDDLAQGSSWTLRFESSPGEILTPGLYLDAVRPISIVDTPGLEVTGDGRGCNMIEGSFEIFEIERSNSLITKLSVTFEQQCDDNPALLKGCVVYTGAEFPE